MQKLTDNIYFMVFEEGYTDRPNVGYIAGENYSLMFEAGASEKHVEQFLDELHENGLKEPDFSVISHWHWDHSFGISSLRDRGVITIASEKTNAKLMEMSGWKWDDASMRERVENGEDIAFVDAMIRGEYEDTSEIKVTPADISFSDRLTIDLGEITCEIIHVGGPHSNDASVCYVPEEKVVFAGDSKSKDIYENSWEYDPDTIEEELDRMDYDMERVQAYLAVMKSLQFDTAIHGHCLPLTRKEFFDSIEDQLK